MTDHVQTSGPFGRVVSTPAERNKVLRNTYWLLALSLLPTVAGAWVGMVTGITNFLGGFMGLAVFMGGAFGFMWAIEKNKNSAAGVPIRSPKALGPSFSRSLWSMLAGSDVAVAAAPAVWFRSMLPTFQGWHTCNRRRNRPGYGLLRSG